MRNTKKVIDWVLNSLRSEPEVWEPTSNLAYGFEHPCGIRVWRGSRSHVSMLAIEYDDDRIGGVTFCSVFFGSLISWRRELRDVLASVKPYKKTDDMLSAISEYESSRLRDS